MQNIFGFFVSGPTTNYNDSNQVVDRAYEINASFRSYIWKEAGIKDKFTFLSSKYGEDLSLILIQFYLDPNKYELESIGEIDNYRKNEKSIGIPIIINTSDFFDIEESKREKYLTKVILQKIDVLKIVVADKKLDTKVEKLISDIHNSLKI